MVLQLLPAINPTPGADGRIVYIAEENDSAWRIAAIFNIPLDKLRELNKWNDNPVIRPGDAILLGFAGPAEASPTPFGPTATPAPAQATPTALIGTGNLCIILYEDTNGDSLRQEEEPSLPGGAISISNRLGTVSQTQNTGAGFDHQCFEQLSEGDYNVTVAVPEGYNPTTLTNRGLELNPGDVTYLDFGAQANSVTEIQSGTLIDPSDEPGSRSPLLGIVGGLFLLVALGMGVFASRLTRTGK